MSDREIVLPDWISFEDALQRTCAQPRHLLLGNGFSMSVHRWFGYGRLFDEAAREDRSLAELFRGHGYDFERALAGAPTEEAQQRIRTAFINALARVHPRFKYLAASARETCGAFLENFAGRETRKLHPGHVFTTNYDLMLYWVLMTNKGRLNLYDGFDRDCVWDATRVSKSTLFYLHGALHHYERPIGFVKPHMEQRKLLSREEASLITQVRDSLDRGHFPVFVSEGTPDEKTQRIRRNRYLTKVGEQFARTCARDGAALFTVGHSLAPVDDHITDRIGSGAVDVFLGVYKPLDDGTRAMELAATWAQRRSEAGQRPLNVRLFDTSECPIWSLK